MKNLKAKIDDLMFILREENPYANWKNLVTGVALLILATLFSISYFSNQQSRYSQAQDIFIAEDFIPTNLPNGAQPSQNVNQTVADGETTIVLKGEGLWHVAKRVCGDPEKYNHIADANNLNVRWARLSLGQELIVDCGN